MDILTQYQSVRYAKRYQTLVNKISAVDLGSDKALSYAAARYAFKLMAYKDEYEIAAPPIISKVDPDSGKVRKRTFGPWMMSAFCQLAKLKGVRGTPLDVFGYSTERKTERALIKEYAETLEDVAAQYDQIDYQQAVQLLSLPDMIRGYGHVKLRNIEIYREEVARIDLLPTASTVVSTLSRTINNLLS